MGIRHATGALEVEGISEVCITDIVPAALDNAKNQLAQHKNFDKLRVCSIEEAKGKYEIAIIASTAGNRIVTCQQVMQLNPGYILIEKPLGQSFYEVEELVSWFDDQKAEASVNLNMRMYGFVRQLKKDLNDLPQFIGEKSINFNGGTLGIGANGIHYLDLLYYLFDANRAELFAGEIEPHLIPSGRGSQFGDFGGWACIKFYNSTNKYLGRSLVSLSSTSTVFGGWEIIGSHGRIRLNELEGQRVDILRKADSELPVNRYAGDYESPHITSIESPLLGDLTREWINSIIKDKKNLLPTIKDSLKVHKLLFDWLSLSAQYKETFPIT